MTRRARTLVFGAVALVLLQVALWFAYRAVTASRARSTDTSYETLADARVPPELLFQQRSGAVSAFSALASARPVLLHFWATWCAPCQRELPTLLEFANDDERPAGLQVVLVALDDDWRPVDAFFAGNVPSLVVRQLNRSPSSELGVSTLPDTYLLHESGKVAARFHGARDWSDEAMSEQLSALLGRR